MGVEIKPIYGDIDKYLDGFAGDGQRSEEAMTDSRDNRHLDNGGMHELRMTSLVGCGIAVTRGQVCWRCGAERPDVALGMWLRDVDGRDRPVVVPFSRLDSAGVLNADCMRDNEYWMHVKFRYSKTMGQSYWANTCLCCGAVQGDNFLFNDFKGRGGGFSNPALMNMPIDWYDIPVFAEPTLYAWDAWVGPFARYVDPRRVGVFPQIKWYWNIR